MKNIFFNIWLEYIGANKKKKRKFIQKTKYWNVFKSKKKMLVSKNIKFTHDISIPQLLIVKEYSSGYSFPAQMSADLMICVRVKH